MNKKLILLILVLPLFLMISLFTATKTVSLAVDVPVSGIDIIGDNVVYLDFDQNETYKVDYAVYPTNAKNREVIFSTEKSEGSDLAELEFVDGYIVPKSIGTAKVYLTTVDGGYKDSFIVQVDSNRLQSIECSVEKDSLLVGETVSVSTVFKPSNASDMLLDYSSSDNKIAKVNSKGQITAIGRGSATITVSSKANPEIKDTVVIDVYQNEPIVIVQNNFSTWNHSGTVNISVKDTLAYEYSYRAYDASGRELTSDEFSLSFDTSGSDNGHVTFDYRVIDESYIGAVKIEITASYDGTAVTEECEITIVDEIDAEFDKSVFDFFVGQNVMATFSLTPEDADVTYSASLSNGNAHVILADDGYVALYAAKAGVCVLTLRITDEVSGESKEISANIVIKPKSLIIEESAKTYGDEDMLTVGAKEFDGSPSTVEINLAYKASEAGEGFRENLSFVTDCADVTVVKYGEKGIITIKNNYTGKVSIRGVFTSFGVEYTTAPMTVYCVGDGVNVRSFKELYETVNLGVPVVLHKDIVDDFGYIDGNMFYNETTVKKINTTYDSTYYKNIGKQDEAKVKVLLEFKNDLYGNGYTINAGNVTTMGIDGTGMLKDDALFGGPLDFVRLTESATSAVSVRAQDNICFALYEDVSVRNVKLYGCSLDADQEEGKYDLTDLDYVGTTVEVLGDNVDISYSRIHNGRTVLRAFGDINDPEKIITLNISNSVLGRAREFIIRMGSNCFVDAPEAEDFAPSRLPGDVSTKFPSQKKYSSMTADEKAAYEASFIKTFVNVKNSVFTESGIFAVGIDSHFSGVYLDRGNSIFQNGQYASFVSAWYDLAKTSYGAKLTFEGEVRMYSWKDIEDVDSSTLIEIGVDSQFADKLKFDVAEMVKDVAANDNFNNIIYSKDGKQYVHAAIAFFGGGMNYGVFEYKNPTSTQFSEFSGYEIGLADVGKDFLTAAAGKEKFYFLLCDSTSQFLPEEQERLLQSENAYDCIHKKDNQ